MNDLIRVADYILFTSESDNRSFGVGFLMKEKKWTKSQLRLCRVSIPKYKVKALRKKRRTRKI